MDDAVVADVVMVVEELGLVGDEWCTCREGEDEDVLVTPVDLVPVEYKDLVSIEDAMDVEPSSRPRGDFFLRFESR